VSVAQQDTPIFVVGAGRSGSTLLQALIGAHSAARSNDC
jgi:hypothetical protein